MNAPAPETGLADPAGLDSAGCPAAPAGFAMRTAGFAPAAPSSFAALRPRAAASPAATAAGKPAVVAAAARPVPAGAGQFLQLRQRFFDLLLPLIGRSGIAARFELV